MNKQINFTVPLILTICLAPLLNGCAQMKMNSRAPRVDYTDSCNDQVQTIVRNSGSDSTFTLSNELNDLASVSLDTVLRGGDFDISDWLRGRGKKHLQTLNQQDGLARLMGQINDSAVNDARTINQLNRDIASLNRCREGQRRTIKSQYSARRISRLQAQNQFTELQQRTDRDNVYISQLLGNSGERISTYQETIREYGGSTASVPRYSTGTRFINYSTLNVRSQPSTSGAKLGVLKRGDAVDVEQSVGNWLAINYQGRPAYIWAKSTSKYPVQGAGSTAVASGAGSAVNETAKSVQNAQNAQRDGEQKNQELAELKRQIDDDLAILDETLDET